MAVVDSASNFPESCKEVPSKLDHMGKSVQGGAHPEELGFKQVVRKRKCRSLGSKEDGFPTLADVGTSSVSSIIASKLNESPDLSDSESLSSRDADVQELRQKLESGGFEEHFSYRFWKPLHDGYGIIAGYTTGFLIIMLLKWKWVIEEVTDSTEGHSVSKTLAVLFLFYGFSCITFALEAAQLLCMYCEICFPKFFRKLKDYVYHCSHPLYQKWASSKYFLTLPAGLWCAFFAGIGCVLWNWFWWNHVCKSYHDRTCRKSWIGKLVIEYRDKACYDGMASSVMCEKLVSYSPIMIATVLFVFLANVLMPAVNDYLSNYHPSSTNAAALRDLLNRLEESEESSDRKATGIPVDTSNDVQDANATDGDTITSDAECFGTPMH